MRVCLIKLRVSFIHSYRGDDVIWVNAHQIALISGYWIEMMILCKEISSKLI